MLIALGHLAVQAVVEHDYPRAGRHAREAIVLAERHGWERTWPAGAAFVALGAAEYLWDRLDDAARSLARGQEALASTRERPLRALLGLVRAAVLNAGGDPETALAVLGAGSEQLRGWPMMPQLAEQFIVLEALLRAQLGNREQARRLLDGASPSPAISVALAQLRLAHGEPEAARAELAAVERRARRTTARPPASRAASSTRWRSTRSPSTTVPRSRSSWRSTTPSPAACAGCRSASAARCSRCCDASSAAAPSTAHWSASCSTRSRTPTGTLTRRRHS